MSEDQVPTAAQVDTALSWRSVKLWYSIVLQLAATALLLHGVLPAELWVWVTSMIYGGYVLGNLGSLAIGASSFTKGRAQ